MQGTWWNEASLEKRLEQIDGGIDCGMTVKQVALICGVKAHVISRVARANQRKFDGNLSKNLSPYDLAQRRRKSMRSLPQCMDISEITDPCAFVIFG